LAAFTSSLKAVIVRAVESTRLSDFGCRLRLVTESCFDIGFMAASVPKKVLRQNATLASKPHQGWSLLHRLRTVFQLRGVEVVPSEPTPTEIPRSVRRHASVRSHLGRDRKMEEVGKWLFNYAGSANKSTSPSRSCLRFRRQR
jgi:hypothetical protein